MRRRSPHRPGILTIMTGFNPWKMKAGYRGDLWVPGMPVLRKKGHQRGLGGYTKY